MAGHAGAGTRVVLHDASGAPLSRIDLWLPMAEAIDIRDMRMDRQLFRQMLSAIPAPLLYLGQHSLQEMFQRQLMRELMADLSCSPCQNQRQAQGIPIRIRCLTLGSLVLPTALDGTMLARYRRKAIEESRYHGWIPIDSGTSAQPLGRRIIRKHAVIRSRRRHRIKGIGHGYDSRA